MSHEGNSFTGGDDNSVLNGLGSSFNASSSIAFGKESPIQSPHSDDDHEDDFILGGGRKDESHGVEVPIVLSSPLLEPAKHSLEKSFSSSSSDSSSSPPSGSSLSNSSSNDGQDDVAAKGTASIFPKKDEEPPSQHHQPSSSTPRRQQNLGHQSPWYFRFLKFLFHNGIPSTCTRLFLGGFSLLAFSFALPYLERFFLDGGTGDTTFHIGAFAVRGCTLAFSIFLIMQAMLLSILHMFVVFCHQYRIMYEWSFMHYISELEHFVAIILTSSLMAAAIGLDVGGLADGLIWKAAASILPGSPRTPPTGDDADHLTTLDPFLKDSTHVLSSVYNLLLIVTMSTALLAIKRHFMTGLAISFNFSNYKDRIQESLFADHILGGLLKARHTYKVRQKMRSLQQSHHGGTIGQAGTSVGAGGHSLGAHQPNSGTFSLFGLGGGSLGRGGGTATSMISPPKQISPIVATRQTVATPLPPAGLKRRRSIGWSDPAVTTQTSAPTTDLQNLFNLPSLQAKVNAPITHLPSNIPSTPTRTPTTGLNGSSSGHASTPGRPSTADHILRTARTTPAEVLFSGGNLAHLRDPRTAAQTIQHVMQQQQQNSPIRSGSNAAAHRSTPYTATSTLALQQPATLELPPDSVSISLQGSNIAVPNVSLPGSDSHLPPSPPLLNNGIPSASLNISTSSHPSIPININNRSVAEYLTETDKKRQFSEFFRLANKMISRFSNLTDYRVEVRGEAERLGLKLFKYLKVGGQAGDASAPGEDHSSFMGLQNNIRSSLSVDDQITNGITGGEAFSATTITHPAQVHSGNFGHSIMAASPSSSSGNSTGGLVRGADMEMYLADETEFCLAIGLLRRHAEGTQQRSSMLTLEEARMYTFTGDELVRSIDGILTELYVTAKSLQTIETALGKVDWFFTFLVGLVVVIGSSLVITDAIQFLLAISNMLSGAAFAFGTSARNMFESMIFLLVIHPFDVGDRVYIPLGTTTVGSAAATASMAGVDAMDNLVVAEMNLLSTVFERWDGVKLYVPNYVLAGKPIFNVRRSGPLLEIQRMTIDFATPLAKVDELRRRLAAWVAMESSDFTGMSRLAIDSVENCNRMNLSVFFQHNSNWQDMDTQLARRSKMMSFLRESLDALEITYLPPIQRVALMSVEGSLHFMNANSNLTMMSPGERTRLGELEHGVSLLGKSHV